MDHIPDDLLKLQARFNQWWANRIYNCEPIPDQLRDAVDTGRYGDLARPQSARRHCAFVARVDVVVLKFFQQGL
jgi:hypothetical protein